MKLLALDTSGESGSIALFESGAGESGAGERGEGDKGRIVAELNVAQVGRHSEWLMGAVERVLEGAGWTPDRVDVLAMGVGPGSFTGLRIGVSVVKGLAWAMKKPVLCVSTLKALAMNAAEGGVTVCPLLDARKGEVYAALYRSQEAGDGALECVMEDSAVKPVELVERVSRETPGRVVLLGGEDVRSAPRELWPVKASNIALLAAAEGVRVGAGELTPVYLRKSEAELKSPPPARRERT
jgi:tRNA threonylcarbamoyladenosine biosynthesis protein TsaB